MEEDPKGEGNANKCKKVLQLLRVKSKVALLRTHRGTLKLLQPQSKEPGACSPSNTAGLGADRSATARVRTRKKKIIFLFLLISNQLPMPPIGRI